MNRKQYSSSIKKTPYKYPIAKKIGSLMLDGKDYDELFRECVENNLVEIDSLERRKEITNVIYKRLCNLDDYLLDEFCNGDVASSKFILVYAIAKTDLLFFEFLFEKYRDALSSVEHNYISIDDFDDFFLGKKQENQNVAKWGHFTLECLVKSYRNILVESGLGRREKKNIVPNKVMIHPSIEEHIKLIGDTDYLKALLGDD